MRRTSSSFAVLAVLCVSVLLMGMKCGQNNPPHIISLEAAPAEVGTGDSSVVTATTHDEDGDALTFSWSCMGGFLSSTSGNPVTWLAPSGAGTCTVQLVLSDPAGDADTDAVTIKVTQNQPPVISGLTATPSTVKPYESCSLAVSASDPEGGGLTFGWWASGGTLWDSTTAEVLWLAPLQSGSYRIGVEVRDSTDLSARDSLVVTVEKDTTTIIDGSYHVNPLTYRSIEQYLFEGYTVSGHFQVQINDINFLVLDETNYTKWRNNETCYPEVSVSRSGYATFSFQVWTSGTYYFVLDNTFSLLTGKDVYVYAREESP